MKTEIIYEDSEILIIYKPAGLATQSASVAAADVESELRTYLKGKPVFVIHRLDQPVEGLLVFAKTKSAAAALGKQLTSGYLNKDYLAVVLLPGDSETAESGRLSCFLKKGTDKLAHVCSETDPDAKKAELEYNILRTGMVPGESEGYSLALVHIHLLTGRFHQIRAQFADAGMPLLGDLKYGSEQSKKVSAAAGIRSVGLCANSITLKHPSSHKELRYEIKPKGSAFDFLQKLHP